MERNQLYAVIDWKKPVKILDMDEMLDYLFELKAIQNWEDILLKIQEIEKQQREENDEEKN